GPAGLELTSELDQRLIGVVQPPRQDRCNVKQRDRIHAQEDGGIGDVELRDLQRTHVGAVWLIEQHRELAEHGAGLPHGSDLEAFPEDCDGARLQDQQPPGRRGGSDYGLAGLVGCDRKTADLPLEDGYVGNEWHGYARCSVAHLRLQVLAWPSWHAP